MSLYLKDPPKHSLQNSIYIQEKKKNNKKLWPSINLNRNKKVHFFKYVNTISLKGGLFCQCAVTPEVWLASFNSHIRSFKALWWWGVVFSPPRRVQGGVWSSLCERRREALWPAKIHPSMSGVTWSCCSGWWETEELMWGGGGWVRVLGMNATEHEEENDTWR